jgi:iron complex transport system substrate-binding protein
MRLMLLLLIAMTLYAQPGRIISTGPGITEILFALGLGDRVVGVTEYCKYPPEAKNIPKIGSWVTPNLEAILTAKPDLIVVQRTAVHDDAKFRALKLHTLGVQLTDIPSIYSTINAIGTAAGVPERARALNASIRKQLEDVRNRVAGRPPTSVLFIVGRTPGTLEGIISVGRASYHSEVLTLAGGRNIFADSPVAYPKVLHEEILARSPEVIIDMGEHAEATGIAEAQQAKEIALWSRYGSIRAVRNKRIHIVSDQIFVVPGPRVTELARTAARFLHPELFP